MSLARAAALAALLAAVAAAAPARAAVRRFALVAGEPDGGAGTVRLRYAERDARRLHDILLRVGGVRREDARLLLSAGAGAFRRALAELSRASAEARARGERTLLLVFYSGHARDDALRLGEGRIAFAELRAALELAPADVRIGLVDSCRSGAIARAKGVRPAPAFEVRRGADAGPSGLVLIASSAADEDSQESDSIGASWFTHHLASGLLGGADASGDGRVTLAEAYAHAYARTVGSTASSAGGVQHPVFLYDLGGAGDVVLTEVAPAAGGLVFPPASQGLYVILDGSGRAVAEVAKGAGTERRVSLADGRYTLKKRLPDDSGLLVARVDVEGAAFLVDDARMDRVPLDRDPQKGFAGRRLALVAGAGGQRFFSRAARDGLFPPAVLAGLEVAVRDDLGRGLGWGTDLSFGAGASGGHGGGVDAIPVRFTEVQGGVTLWRDLRLGALTLSAGPRIGFIWLRRDTARAAYDLPAQWFFTVTPGLTAAAALRLGGRLSVFVRGRLSYVFYQADQDRSLGFAEGMAGVEWELGE